MSIVIRPVAVQDEAAFLELATGLTRWNQPHRPVEDDLERRLNLRRERARQILVADAAEKLLLLASSDGQPAGYVLAYLERGSDRIIGYIDELYVSEQSRGLGVGRRLMEAAREQLQAAGASVMRLNVFAWNEAAQGFYERLGFRPYSVVYQKLI